MIQLYLNTNILEDKLYRIIYVGLIIIYAIVLYSGMNSMMKADTTMNDFVMSICYIINVNIKSYEQSSNYKVENLKIKVEVSLEGVYKEYENVTSQQQSYILLSLPIDSLLGFYCGLDLDIEYITEKVKDFKNNIDFYYIENTAYLYLNI